MVRARLAGEGGDVIYGTDGILDRDRPLRELDAQSDIGRQLVKIALRAIQMGPRRRRLPREEPLMYRARLVPGASLKTRPSTAFNFGTGDFTIMAMMESTQGGGLLALSETGDGGVQLGVNPDGSVTFSIYREFIPEFTPQPPGAEVVTDPTSILDGGCHTVAGIRADGTLSVTIDGVPVPATPHDDGSGPVPIDNNNFFLTIGNKWAGDVMNVSLWNAALSGDLLVKAAFARITGDEPDLQGYWTLDADLKDLSPNANTGFYTWIAPAVRPEWVYCLGCVWTPTADNAYTFCEIANMAGPDKPPETGPVTLLREVPVPAGAPALCMSIMADQDTPAFPAGAQVTLRDPSGKPYNQNENSDTVFAVLSGGQLWTLMVANPEEGNWHITVSAPATTAFSLYVQTVPSAEVVQTCRQALQPLARRGAAADTWITRALGSVAAGIVVWMLLPVGVATPVVLYRTMRALGAVAMVYQAVNFTSLRAATQTVSTAASFSPTPTVPPGTQYTFQINPQNGGPVQTFTDSGTTLPALSAYRQFIAAIRGHFNANQPNARIAVRLDLETGWSAWIALNMSNFYLVSFNADQNSDGNLNVGQWQTYNENLITYPEGEFQSSSSGSLPVSQIQVSHDSIISALQRSGQPAAINGEHSLIVILAFIISEAARFQVVEYAADATLEFGRAGRAGGRLIRVLGWSYFRELITNWANICRIAFGTGPQPDIPEAISMNFINNDGAFADTPGAPGANWIEYFKILHAALKKSGYPVS